MVPAVSLNGRPRIKTIRVEGIPISKMVTPVVMAVINEKPLLPAVVPVNRCLNVNEVALVVIINLIVVETQANRVGRVDTVAVDQPIHPHDEILTMNNNDKRRTIVADRIHRPKVRSQVAINQVDIARDPQPNK